MTLELAATFLIGLFGSLHCLGMCGPLVLAYSVHIKSPGRSVKELNGSLWPRGFGHHLAYHSGRLLTYGFLGAIAAALFQQIGLNFYLNIRGGLILLGGGLIIMMGFTFLRLIPFPGSLRGFSISPQSLWNRAIPSLFERPGPISQMALGGACGLLPCCLSCSMLIKAALTENVAEGFLTMAVFGLGTVPGLLAVGLSASLVSLRTRLIGERLAALSVIAMGLILAVKGARLLLEI